MAPLPLKDRPPADDVEIHGGPYLTSHLERIGRLSDFILIFQRTRYQDKPSGRQCRRFIRSQLSTQPRNQRPRRKRRRLPHGSTRPRTTLSARRQLSPRRAKYQPGGPAIAPTPDNGENPRGVP
jgi:hypothetical protein